MTSPFILTKIYQNLTSKNQLLKRKLKLGTDEIPIPPKRDDVTTIEAINRFNKANPRVDTTNLKPLSVKHSNVRQSNVNEPCLLYTSPSPRDGLLSRMPSSA